MAKVLINIDPHIELQKFLKEILGQYEKNKIIYEKDIVLIKLYINNLDHKYYYTSYNIDDFFGHVNLFEILIYFELYELAEDLLKFGFDINHRNSPQDLTTFYNYINVHDENDENIKVVQIMLKYEPIFEPINMYYNEGEETYVYDPLNHLEEYKDKVPKTYKIIYDFINNNNK